MKDSFSLLDQLLFWVSVPILISGALVLFYEVVKALLKFSRIAKQRSKESEVVKAHDLRAAIEEEIRQGAREMKIRAFARARDIVNYEPFPEGHCSVCAKSISWDSGNADYGTLHAEFGYGSELDGNKYHVNLCEKCFQGTLQDLHQKVKLLRRNDKAFNSELHEKEEATFGLVSS